MLQSQSKCWVERCSRFACTNTTFASLNFDTNLGWKWEERSNYPHRRPQDIYTQQDVEFSPASIYVDGANIEQILLICTIEFQYLTVSIIYTRLNLFYNIWRKLIQNLSVSFKYFLIHTHSIICKGVYQSTGEKYKNWMMMLPNAQPNYETYALLLQLWISSSPSPDIGFNQKWYQVD